jgi:hypothetical protein
MRAEYAKRQEVTALCLFVFVPLGAKKKLHEEIEVQECDATKV